MTNRSPLLFLLCLAGCAQPDAAQQTAATSSEAATASTETTAEAAALAAAPSNAAALTGNNGVIVSGGPFKSRTVIDVPTGMGTAQHFPAFDQYPPYAMMSLRASNEEHSRGMGISLTVPGLKAGTYQLGPNGQARVILNFDELNNLTVTSYTPASSGTLIVETFGEDGKISKGTFSGTFTNDAGDKITVHEGRYGSQSFTVLKPSS